MQPVPLTDGVVFLNVPTEGDLGRITEFCQDPEIQRWVSIPAPYSYQDSVQFLTTLVNPGWASGAMLTWSLRLEPDGPLVGMIGVNGIADGAGEVGYWLAAEARGKRLMTRALRLVIDHVFDPAGLHLHHLTWRAQTGNWASRRAAWHVGFRVEGTVRSLLLQRGEWRDGWLGTLHRDDPREPNTTWFAVPTLRGSNVMLRRFVESDADAVVEASNDPVSRHWLGNLPSPYTRETAVAYIGGVEDEHAGGRAIHWAAAPVEGGSAIGSFSLMRFVDHGAEVGYWVHPAARGRGVATEGVRLMVAHSFAPVESGGLGLRRLTLAHAEGNHASGRVAERAGFTHTGMEHRAAPLGDGSYADLHWHELLAP